MTQSISSTAGLPARTPSRGLVLALVLTAQLMVMLDTTVVNIALPDMLTDLHFSPTGLSWVINAYTLAFGGLMLLGARAGDLIGRRPVFLAGIAVFTVASLAGGFATSPALLLAARALQGLGGALAAPSALALLMIMYPTPVERTRAMSYYTAVSVGGSAVGLLAGGMLTQWVSWRWVLFVNVPIGVAVLLVGLRVLPAAVRRSGHFDLAGSITSTIGMTALVYGFVRAASDGWGDPVTVAGFVVGAVLLSAFFLVERRAESPITPLRLFTDRDRVVAYVARLLLMGGMLGVFFFLTQFLQEVLGYSALASGFAFLPLTAVVFSSSQLVARVLINRVGTKTIIVTGLSLSTLGLLWLTQLDASSGYVSVLGPLLLFGLGNGTAFVPLSTMALKGVAPADAGAGSGLMNVIQQVGGSLGLAVLITIFGSASKSAISPAGASAAERAQHAFVVGADRGFLVAAGFLALTLLTVLLAMRSDRPQAPAVNVSDDAAELAGVAAVEAI